MHIKGSLNGKRRPTHPRPNQDTIEFFQNNTLNETMKEINRGYFIQLQADENNSYIFEESFQPLGNMGIHIESGTNNTQSYGNTFETPLGHNLYPVIYANTTLFGGNPIVFVHEIKRALGFHEVAWAGTESVMETPVQNYSQEDKDIAQHFDRPYWNAVYKDNKTWIDANNLAEDLND
ncbi:MAG: hypothetical protein DRJ05_05000 [Bacteroidetes bacterium]|nr:MAG: hypothetical protein DRJ05_05000 [Bacteroidota bacterium]